MKLGDVFIYLYFNLKKLLENISDMKNSAYYGKLLYFELHFHHL